LKRHNLISWFACVFGLSIFAHSQARPTAESRGTLQIGGGLSYASPDYGSGNNVGPTFFLNYDFTPNLGLEAAMHYTSIITPGDIGEDTYLLGPRYVFHHRRFMPYAKVLAGVGVINLQFDYAPHRKYSKFVYAFGGGLDYRVTRKVNVRVIDFEYQQWPGFSPNGLSPYVITAGAAYTFH
jgi:opacity protein-like surface antigen